MLTETERTGWDRWPVPLGMYRGMRQVGDGIVEVRLNADENTTPGDKWGTKMLAPRSAGEVIYWPNTTPKVLYLSALLAGDTGNFPDYAHSCRELDELLMGAVPTSFFTDLSRAGILGLPKAYGYVHHTLGKHERAGKKGLLDSKLDEFYHKYGMFGCVPLTSRVEMFDYIQREDLNSYLVPGSSVAEAFTALVRRIDSEALNKEISALKGESWVSQEDRSGTGILADHMDAYLRVNFPDLYWLVMYLEDKELVKRDVNLNSLAYPYVTLLARMVNRMVEQPRYKLPQDPAGKVDFWNQKIYDRTPEAVIADVSELVVKRKRPESPLSPLPWNTFILFGYPSGYTANTTDQMRLNAELIRHYYPGSWVFMMLDSNGSPRGYDPKMESDTVLRAKNRGNNVTRTASAMQGIVEFGIGQNIQKGISLCALS